MEGCIASFPYCTLECMLLSVLAALRRLSLLDILDLDALQPYSDVSHPSHCQAWHGKVPDDNK